MEQRQEWLVPGASIEVLHDRPEGVDERKGARLHVVNRNGTVIHTTTTRPGIDSWVFHVQNLGSAFSLVSSPAHVPPPPPEVASKAEAQAWLNQLMSTVGRGTIDPEVHAKILECGADKVGINKIFFPYHAANPVKPGEVTREQVELLDSMVTPRTSPAYLEAERRHRDLIASAEARARDVHNYVTHAAAEWVKMEQILGNTALPMSGKVKEILAGGWYTLKNVTPEWVKFMTPPINIKHYNAQANIHQDVLMGSYEVQYRPRNGELRVYEGAGNHTVGGYIHPHIDTSGSVCWGNARAVSLKALTEFNPKEALEALQVILQNYNSESPYVSLQRYVDYIKANARAGQPLEYRKAEDKGWIRHNDMPDSWAITYQHDEGENGDGDTVYLMDVFYRCYSDGEQPSTEESTYYVKYSNGRYCPIDEADIEWE